MNDKEITKVIQEYGFTREDYDSVAYEYLDFKYVFNGGRNACIFGDGDSGVCIITLSEAFDEGILVRNIDCNWSEIPMLMLMYIYEELTKASIRAQEVSYDNV